MREENLLGPVAISGERDMRMQTLKNNLRECQQGAAGVDENVLGGHNIVVYTEKIPSAYTPHAALNEEVKRRFWEGLDGIVRQVPPAEKLFIEGDFNGHIGSITGGYGEVHGGFGFRDRKGGGTSLLDFVKAFGLVIANSSFLKREEHLVTFQIAMVKTQIDYLLLRRYDRGLCKDFKAILGEILATQHRLLVMDVGIMLKRRKRSA
ncbi:PREDICTED: craniofacial development protein 2-like [Nicotiana attenuata]|uniref:craniofacial development protein 2-like n=1 Tax=Nicotiana attenuata TaxID=49451 RepID=UPI000904F220|nr:PREDICTED: craniofacial development protein 2-like [Nicotiana attenuata]